MTTFQNILFPVDFSDRCAQSASHVAAIARNFNGKVTLLHALGDYEGIYTPDAPSAADWYNWLRDERETKMESFGTPCLDPFVTARVVDEGDPAGLITNYAMANPIDLIVLPTHGRGTFRSLLLGSVTAKVLHDTTLPVWTMAHVDEPRFSASNEIRNILCAVDLAPESTRTLEHARDVASAFGATVRIVHSVPVPGAGPEVYMNTEFSRFLQDAAEEQIAAMQKEAGTQYEVMLQSGDIATVIRDAAREFSADLVIVGRGCMQETFGRLRSHEAAIIHKSPCPVLSF